MLELITSLKPHFTDEDKERCLPVVHRMLELADSARREGLLSIGEKLKDEDAVFLKLILALIMDGCDPELVGRTAQHLILSEGYTGYELLSRLVIAQGCLYIRERANPMFMARQLGAMLGESRCLRAVDDWEAESRDANAQAMERLMESAKSKPALPECRVLGTLESRLPAPCVPRVLKEVENRELAIALSGCGRDVIERIFMNVSERMRTIIAGDIDSMDILRDEDVENAAGKIIDNIKRLEERGFIVLKRKDDELVYY